MQKQKKEKKRVKKKMAANWRIKRNFSLRGEGGPGPGQGQILPGAAWDGLVIHQGSPGLSYVSIYTPDGRKYVVSWGCFPGGLCSVFSGPISPVCRLGPGAIFFPVFFSIFLVFQCLHRAGQAA